MNAENLIKKLKLIKHPEGGYFREVYRSNEKIYKACLPERFNDSRDFSTSIYYLLKSGDISAFHRIKSDELWHFYSGTSLFIHMINKQNKIKTITLGNNPDKDELFQFTVPENTWFAANVKSANSYSLVGCTVSPGFDYNDFEIGIRDELIKLYPKLEEYIIKFT